MNFGTLKSPFMFMCDEFAPIRGTEYLILPPCEELFALKIAVAALSSFGGSMFCGVWGHPRLGVGKPVLREAVVSHESGTRRGREETWFARTTARGWGVVPGGFRGAV